MPDPVDPVTAFTKAWATVTIALTLFVAVVALSQVWDPAVFDDATREALVGMAMAG